jgi:tetratricopeptide (TPR) repeat protein
MEDRTGDRQGQLGCSEHERKVSSSRAGLSPRSGAEAAVRSDALRLAPNSPDVLTTRGLVLFLTGKLPQALQHVQSALRLDPGHEAAMQLRKRVKEVERLKEEGNKSFKSGVLDDAIEKYTAAIEVNHSCIEHETVQQY